MTEDMEKIIIIGGRGTAIVIAEQIIDAKERFGKQIEVLGLALDDLSGGSEINEFPIICSPSELMSKYGKHKDVKFIYSLYRPDVMEERTKLLYSYDIPLEKYTNFIHPTVMQARSAKLGIGNVILTNTVINPNFEMGNFNTINSLCLLGHDSKIGNNNYFAGEVCLGSGVKMGDKNFVGLNSTIRNGLQIGDNSIIAMASNVVKNVENQKIVMGNPAFEKEKLNNVIR
ncbi:MAG: sialic acid O-acetyltransferase [Bacteroidales bacterium]|nr:sialic acid O-acetyltransferase [Bacteroidales bacterium]